MRPARLLKVDRPSTPRPSPTKGSPMFQIACTLHDANGEYSPEYVSASDLANEADALARIAQMTADFIAADEGEADADKHWLPFLHYDRLGVTLHFADGSRLIFRAKHQASGAR